MLLPVGLGAFVEVLDFLNGQFYLMLHFKMHSSFKYQPVLFVQVWKVCKVFKIQLQLKSSKFPVSISNIHQPRHLCT